MEKLESMLGKKGGASLKPGPVASPPHLYEERDNGGGIIISYNKMKDSGTKG